MNATGKGHTVLVTGAAGGLGSSTCRVLAGAGFRVRALIRPEDDPSRVPLPTEDVQVGYVQCPQAAARALRGVDGVVNCAALLPNALALGARAFQEVNVGGPRNLLEQARRLGVRRAVFFSTISVVDHVSGRVARAEMCRYVDGRHDPYLVSKIDMERALRAASDSFPGHIAVLRPAFIYGPGNYAVWAEALALVRRGKMRLVGDGSARLPLIYADDVARAVARLLASPSAGPRHTLHVLANPEPTTMAEVFSFLADLLGAPRPGRAPAWPLALAAALVSLVPPRLRFGRLKLLTPARVRQYSRGYDLSGVLPEPLLDGLALTGYREGLRHMVDDDSHPAGRREAA